MRRSLPSTGWLCALFAAAALAACADDPKPAPPDPPDPDPEITQAPAVAQTKNGPVQATDKNDMRSYFAIPYAAPPVGPLRWAAPAAPASWTAPRARTESAAACLQTSASPFRLMTTSEDCLYLDVHAPTTDSGPFPVMVWIHGGAFNTGGAATFAKAAPLVSKGVIVVNIAYRLGPLGFLAHPALEVDGAAGNYGIMDQQAALRWVKDNIEQFAGDPDNVTIFGESAGGFSVQTHLVAAGSRGLFHKAIVESGGYAFDRQIAKADMAALSTTVVDTALTTAGITTCTPVTAACLRALPVEFVGGQLATTFNGNPRLSSPVPSIDGKVLTRSVKEAFAAGDNAKVPTIVGTNSLEYSLFIAIGELGRRTAANNFDPTDMTLALQATAYEATLSGLTGGRVTGPMMAQAYPLTAYGTTVALQPSLGASAAGTDIIFACPSFNFAKRTLAQQTPVWMYEFRDETAIPSVGLDMTGKYFLSFPQGAGHSYELQYVFDIRPLGNDERNALREAMTRYWTNFARTGDPNQGTAPAVAWPAFSAPDKILGLDVASRGGIKPLETSFDAAHKCSTVWSALTF